MIKQLFTTSFRFRLATSSREWLCNPFLTILFLILLYALISLGLWQLDRSEQKKDIIAQVESVKSQQPLSLDLTKQPKDYTPVTFELTARPETVLIANEPHQGRDGFFVLQLAEGQNGLLVWINRGWIAANPNRAVLPTFSKVAGTWKSAGEVYFSKGEPLLFENALQKTSENIWVLQGLSFERLQNVILPSQSSVLPYIIRLDESSDKGFVRDWQYIAMQPEKHLAYAVQWFGLAIALTSIFILLSIRRTKESS